MFKNIRWAIIIVAVSAAFAFGHDIDGGGHHDGPTDLLATISGDGAVKISRDLQIGNTILLKGKYVMEHTVSGTQHVIVFTPVPEKGKPPAGVLTLTSKAALRGENARKSFIHAKEDARGKFHVQMI